MYLTNKENHMLEGKYGLPVQKSMEILVALGECYDAQRMIPVSSAHLLYSISALGKGGTLFLHEMADRGCRFVIDTDTNAVSFEPSILMDFGMAEKHIPQQNALATIMRQMGALLSHTCAPYLVGHVPRMGEHIAWNESSAIVFANSVLGARSNREGGPSAFAAAVTGRVPEYGYHLNENRLGNLKVVVETELRDPYDYGTLGYFTGKLAQDSIPVFLGIPPHVSWDALKILGAAAATSGSVALYHAIGITPEAPDEKAAWGGEKVKDWQSLHFGQRELHETEEYLSVGTAETVDLVILGCPHASITQLRNIARLLSGKRLRSGVELWVSTTHMVKAYGDIMGYVQAIESSGARMLCGTCPMALCRELIKNNGPRVISTDSPKLANGIGLYSGERKDITVHYGPLERCIASATSGIWRL